MRHLKWRLSPLKHVQDSATITHGNICISNMQFGYNKDTPILKLINLHILSGEKIGLIGASGEGKSTLMHLIAGNLTPTHGNIQIDRVAPASFDPSISVIPQTMSYFHRNIYENMVYGLPAKPLSTKLLSAIQDSELHHIIKNSNRIDDLKLHGMDQLSGGEKQKVLLTRCFLHSSKLILLDEATSALDLQSEYRIVQKLIRRKRSATLIFTGHRLPIFQLFDRVCVLDKGTIVELGSHQTLLQQKGVYYALWQKMYEHNTELKL